jgi:hypothetical protein
MRLNGLKQLANVKDAKVNLLLSEAQDLNCNYYSTMSSGLIIILNENCRNTLKIDLKWTEVPLCRKNSSVDPLVRSIASY